jgi:leucyl/phenylalanyl-tRNA--protein transferase
MADPDQGGILWFCPDPRTILPLESFTPSRSVRGKRRARRFAITFDRDFAGVLDACADRPRTWINAEIRRSYLELHRMGAGPEGAHSVEAWLAGTLAGGLYGVRIGRAFMAESMFHRATDAGMAALAALVERLRERSFEILDVQFTTPHLRACGAVELPRDEYLRRLAAASSKPSRSLGA